MPHIALITLVVRDYDEAIDFYTGALGFELAEDTDRGDGSRWVVVRPRGSAHSSVSMLLARAKDEAQLASVGAQTGGRVGFFLHTEDFAGDHARMLAAGSVSWRTHGMSRTVRWPFSRTCTEIAGTCCSRPEKDAARGAAPPR